MNRQNNKNYKKLRKISEDKEIFYDELLFKKTKEQQKRKRDLDRQYKQKYNYNQNQWDEEDRDY